LTGTKLLVLYDLYDLGVLITGQHGEFHHESTLIR